MVSQLPRRQVMNHQPVQGALLRHTMLTWLGALASWTLVSCTWNWLWDLSPDNSPVTRQLTTAILATLLLGPWLLIRVIRLSNRFLGPVHRVKSGLKRLARHDAVERLEFRGGDFFPELAAAFNDMLARCDLGPKQSTKITVAAECSEDVLQPT